jgi:large subunit ribosomal protein L15
MNIADVKKAAGKHKKGRRLGRGNGSGWGKTCAKGQKGQKSRSGYSGKAQNEGGQMPLFRRLPKRGFNNARYRVEYQLVNVSALDRFDDGAAVTPEALAEAGLIRSAAKRVKVLGTGDLKKKLTITADAFSSKAEEKVAAAGGSITKRD